MKEEKNSDDVRELKEEELEGASGGGMIYMPPMCPYCKGFLHEVGEKEGNTVFRCMSCGQEVVNKPFR